MNAPEHIREQLYALEERLLDPQFRRQRSEVARLLADDFREFGASGRIYDKPQILSLLEAESDNSHREVSQFEVQPLAEGIALVTYRVARINPTNGTIAHSLRSSIWKWQDVRWQMTFHQGTSTEAVNR